MKRKGRRHGMVRTFLVEHEWSGRRNPRGVSKLVAPPTAGPFTKVSSKPTNHSKFTSNCVCDKCRYKCYLNPDKGPHKVLHSHSTIPGFKVSAGLSATALLDYLDPHDYDQAQDSDHHHHHVGFDGYYDHDHDTKSHGVEVEQIDGCDGDDDDDDDDRMSFCEVGFVWEALDGDESCWCLVDQI